MRYRVRSEGILRASVQQKSLPAFPTWSLGNYATYFGSFSSLINEVLSSFHMRLPDYTRVSEGSESGSKRRNAE